MDPIQPAPSVPQEKPARQFLSVPVAIILAGALIAGSILYVNAGQGGEPAKDASSSIDIREVSATDHIYGSLDAPVKLVEYSDYECPYCSRIHPDLKRLIDDSQGKVAWVFRHFPLTSIHAQALPAAIAAECVAKLGGNDAFWSFTNGVFADQRNIGAAQYERLATASGVSAADFRACVASDEFNERIAADFTEAVEAGGNGTPYVVILSDKETTSFAGALPYATMKQVVDGLLR